MNAAINEATPLRANATGSKNAYIPGQGEGDVKVNAIKVRGERGEASPAEVARWAVEQGVPLSRETARRWLARMDAATARARALDALAIEREASALGLPITFKTALAKAGRGVDADALIADMRAFAARTRRREAVTDCIFAPARTREATIDARARCKCADCLGDLARELSHYTRKIASGVAHLGLDLDDAEQESYFALLCAVDTWPDDGTGHFKKWFAAHLHNYLLRQRERNHAAVRWAPGSISLQTDVETDVTVGDLVPDRSVDVAVIVEQRETLREWIASVRNACASVGEAFDQRQAAFA